MRIGIAGLDRMGTAIAERLKEMGHDVVVWNRSAEKTRLLADAGAEVASTPADLAGRAEVILTILTDAEAIETVYRGPSGVLSADLAGKLVIEMSTVQPETEVKLAAKVRAKGAAFVECPVGGTVGPARTGKLIGLAGTSEADFARAKPILDQLCRRLEHVGEVGAGASMKLAINLPLMVFYQALGEAYALTKHLGKDTGWMIDLFADSSGGPNVLKNRGPTIAKALSGEDLGAPAFDVDSIRKDLRTMIAEGSARGFDLPLVSQALAIYDQAADAGWGKRDGSTLPAFWSHRQAR